MFVRIVGNTVGRFGKDDVVEGSAFGSDLDRLIELGAVVETEDEPTVRSDPAPMMAAAPVEDQVARIESALAKANQEVDRLHKKCDDMQKHWATAIDERDATQKELEATQAALAAANAELEVAKKPDDPKKGKK